MSLELDGTLVDESTQSERLQFLEFAQKGALARKLGLTQEQYAALSPQERSKLLIKGGISVPIVAGDWSVNRMRHSADLVGLTGWEELQTFLANNYSTGEENEIHFHKGPGNGALMDDLRRKSRWEQIGMGDRLYFTVEDTLLKFAKPGTKEMAGFNDFLSVLGLGLRRALKEKWFENSDSHVVGELKMKEGEKVNLNDLRLMVKDPNRLFEKLEVKESEAGRMEYLVSVEFEKDGYAPLPDEAKALFIEFKNAMEQGSVEQFFRRFFDELIFDEQHDLNEDAVFHDEGFMPGYFKEISKQVPVSSCLLMSAIRSDSHEDAQSFAKDIRKNLACLKPGGVLLTDGNRQSYTRFSRLKEIQDALKGNPEFQARVICGKSLRGESGEILGVAIQRKHPHKDFFWELAEDEQPFKEDVEYLTLQGAMDRPDQRLLDSVLGLVYRWAKEDMGVFRSLHGAIREAVNKVLLDFVVENGLLHDIASEKLDLVPSQIAEIREKLLPVLGGLLPPRDPPTVEPEGVRVFDRIGQKRTPFNRDAFIPAAAIPRHESDATHFSAEEKHRWAEEFLEVMGSRALFLVDPDGEDGFFGCETNVLFDEFLRAALGGQYEDCVIHVPFKLNPTEMSDRLMRALNEQGGLVFAGGSWEDLASQGGREYERRLMGPLLSQMLAGESQVGLVAECFSAQALANRIGELVGGRAKKLKIKKGSWEFGPFATSLEGEHPIYKDLPRRLAIAMTRSGHIVGEADHQLWTPLAHLEYSGEAVLWAGLEDRILATAGHPTIRQHTQVDGSDVDRVMRFIRRNPLALVESHGVVSNDLASNWPVLKENPGTRLLANMLMVAAHASQNLSKWEMSPA